MSIWPWLILPFLTAACKQPEKHSFPTSGTYLGLESMGASSNDITPDDITDRWYHENTLVLRGDSVFLSKSPVVFYKGQGKAYSASDGGFYSYKGKIRLRNDSMVAQLLLVSHDYVMTPYRVLNYSAKDSMLSMEELVKQGRAEIDSSFLKRSYRIQVSPSGHLPMDGVDYRLQ